VSIHALVEATAGTARCITNQVLMRRRSREEKVSKSCVNPVFLLVGESLMPGCAAPPQHADEANH
jgi:hypothetical protein